MNTTASAGTRVADVAGASLAVAATSSRTAKIRVLCDLLRSTAPEDVGLVVLWLSGQTRQRRTGLGWASLRDLPPPAGQATLTVHAVDEILRRAQDLSGAGSTTARRDLVLRLFSAATADEQRFLAALVMGELRQGAQAGVVLDAVASAAGVPKDALRRALTMSGDLALVSRAAIEHGAAGLAAFGLRVGTPLSPMLAQSAADLDSALARTGAAGVEWKLDGVRVQVHKSGGDVAVFTRTLDDITSRVPEVVRAARALPAGSAVLDGEVLALRPSDGRPLPFQVTSSRVARQDVATAAEATPLTPWFFDALHLDGQDVLDLPGRRRRALLEAALPADLVVPRTEVPDLEDDEAMVAVRAFAASALAHGHEGVLVKGLDAPYAMGRRGAGWVKVKPRITLDLVVLAAEWGHGRRSGWLSNLHLGARDAEGEYGPEGGFVMLGKTFKGLTDEMLRWQTEALQALSTASSPVPSPSASPAGSRQVDVRSELVVEIAFDAVQDSTRYPAGMALRFARVLAHRPDKPAAQADTIATVRAYRDAARA